MTYDNLRAIEPLSAPLVGSLRVPGDKSISHRSVLFSAMAEGTSHIAGVLDSNDVRSSLAAVEALGAHVDVEKMPDGSFQGTITGWGAKGPKQPSGPIDCGNSGTTVRLLMGILAPWPIRVELTGDESLCRRPMRRITGPLSLMGASFQPEGKETLPITVVGGSDLHGIEFAAPVASAQLKTALLLAGIFAEGETDLTEPAPSRDHTERMLPGYGVAVDASPCHARVLGAQTLNACDVLVPGDPSSAAFMACAAALREGSSVTIEGVSINEARIGFVHVLESMGADISVEQTGSTGREPVGNIHVSYTPTLHGCEIGAQAIASLVDEVPVLALVAARAEGETVFREVGELRVKETDRLAAIIEGLELLGVKAWVEGDDLHIQGEPGKSVPEGLQFDSRKDHRLAMTWSLVSLCLGKAVSVNDFEAVSVSYPSFLEDIERLSR